MKQIRAAVLGMGNMGRAHLGALRRMEEVEVVGLCASTTASPERYNAENGTSFPVYDTFARMLDEARPDVLYVCLPPFAHCGQIEAAAARGIHIFTEKPLAMDLERGRAMVEAVERAGVVSQVGYHMRFGKAVRRVRELIEAGAAGRPTLFTANYQCNSLHGDWWRDRSKSGGQIFEQVIHLYDMAWHLVGGVDRVTGFVSNLCHRDVPGYTVEDTSAVALRFENGALGTITASNNAIPGVWVGIFKVIFENMVVEFSDHNHCRITYTREGNRVEVVDGEDTALFDENRRFIDAVLGKAAPTATIAEGFAGLQIVCAACASSDADGKPVKIGKA